MLTVYLHPRCSDSWHVYKLLEKNSLLELVKLANTEQNPLLALSKSIFSVPAFELSGKVVLQGYFTDEEVISLVRSGKIYVGSPEEALDRLMKSVFSSFLVASAVYLSGSFSVLLDARDYVYSASGALFLPEHETFLELARSKLKAATLGEHDEKYFVRIIAGNFIRDLYWLRGEPLDRSTVENLGYSYFREWMLLRSSLGRVFVPHSRPPAHVEEKVRRAWEYTLDRADTIIARVVEEQASIPDGWV
ncbi:hypothetical protein IG193_07275 [Infirmifilum lucidum]|uniref:Uncharacterized protein n=1 Tax=Infirmifilum lucidum TaxID=2776706 RepID=A0A7L9FFI7_9CREN|nr:hypothetical protein [Infirmifilum lucidum]QOJ78550.1 hypothetical protein IG193_07275 [Infirmifilum lucidum]